MKIVEYRHNTPSTRCERHTEYIDDESRGISIAQYSLQRWVVEEYTECSRKREAEPSIIDESKRRIEEYAPTYNK
jgi:hypothetical protein